MYDTSDIRKNLKIKMDGDPWAVTDFQFVKPGKGAAFTRTKLRNLITGQTRDENFRSGTKLEPADLDDRDATLLYREGDEFIFMDDETYEQYPIPAEVLGDGAQWLNDGMPVAVLFYEGRPVTVEPPKHVELEITWCEPGIKGNTATNATKTAEVSTGARIQVPLFIEQGEVVRIDTRTGTYQTRVS